MYPHETTKRLYPKESDLELEQSRSTHYISDPYFLVQIHAIMQTNNFSQRLMNSSNPIVFFVRPHSIPKWIDRSSPFNSNSSLPPANRCPILHRPTHNQLKVIQNTSFPPLNPIRGIHRRR